MKHEKLFFNLIIDKIKIIFISVQKSRIKKTQNKQVGILQGLS